jgi:hypothetical protein
MAEFIKDGFSFFDGFFGEPVFNFSDLAHDKISYLLANRIKNVSIDNSIIECDFLEKLDFIEEIYISDSICLKGIYHLKNLKRIVINIENKKDLIDFSCFPKLEILSIDWYNNFPDLSKNENLKELSVWKFKPKSKSLAELSLPKNLEKLHITESNILSLEGLELDNLKEFEGHYCNALETVKGIRNFSKNLNVLILDYCRKLTSYEDLKFAKNVEKLILGNSGDIPNLKWLKNLKKVKHFTFVNTKITDGDTSPCFGIDYIGFKNQKHYNYKEEDIKNNKSPQN